MSLEAAKPVRVQNSFVDALHSEIVAGSENLTGWIRLIQERGAIESLFGLETWLKAIRSFFELDNLPLSDAEKNGLATRSFAPEIGVVRQALGHAESLTCAVIDAGCHGTL